jgi:thiol-disulfide isomerase/thioredoxin
MKLTKSKLKHYFKEIIFFMIAMTIIANIMSLYRSQSLSSKPLSITNFQLINNNIYKVDHTKPIIIHFWATWCPTCKLEASNINFLSKQYQVITIAVKSGSDNEIKKYMRENNYNFNVVNDQNGTLSQKFKIAAFPTTFIYDKNKKLIFREVGYSSTFGLWLRVLWSEY